MRRDLFIILQLGLAFLLIFAAFNSQGFIEIAVLRSISQNPGSGISANSGYYSMSVIYFVFTFCNLLAPPVISRLGPKLSMILGAACYALFLAGFLQLSAWLLYSLSALLGMGAALIWTANGVYLVRFSREGKMARNSAIMWTMLQTSLVVGAIFLAIVLHESDLVSSFRFVYAIFTGICVAGIIVLIALPSSPESIIFDEERAELIDNEILPGDAEQQRPPSRNVADISTMTLAEEFGQTFALVRTPKMAMLIALFLFSGIESSFYAGVYTACLSAFKHLSDTYNALIAYAVLAMGAGQIVGGLWFGLGAKTPSKFGRTGVVMFGIALHFTAYFLCFLNLPMTAPLGDTTETGYVEPSLVTALITAFMLGLADSALHTQLYTMLGGIYKDELSSAAFALFKFFQSLASCAAFYYGSVLLLHWQLLILVIFGAAGAVAFFTVHAWASQEIQTLETTEQ
ncbi:unnamed protein product, partial [Mesorhabditis spiculigera]